LANKNVLNRQKAAAYFKRQIETVRTVVEVVNIADSNRQALGQGHIDFSKVVSGMKAIGFDRTIVL
jgi:sugar phosphate isomerase/epimerase